MTLHRSWDEQARIDEAEDEYQRIQMLEGIEPDGGPARLMDMSWPTAEVTVEPQPEYEPRRTVRSHEVRAYGKTSVAEWIFLIGALLLIAGWCLLLIAVFAASVA